MSSARVAFLASLAPGQTVWFVTDVGDGVESRADAVIQRIGTRSIVVVLGDLTEVRLDSYGYRLRSASARIEPSHGAADEANAWAAVRAESHRQAMVRARAAG